MSLQPIYSDSQESQNSMRFQQLVDQSLDVLEAILSDDSVSVRDRALIALEILERVESMTKQADLSTLKISAHQAFPTCASEGIDVSQAHISTNGLGAVQGSFSHRAIAPIVEFAAPVEASIAQETVILPINFIQIDNFLSSKDFEQALQIAFSNEAQFTDSSVHNKQKEQIKKYRQSAVLHHKYYASFANFFQEKVIATLPSVLDSLNRPHFEVSNSVIQLTAHNDGCYYTVHSDANTEATKTREMTYVYYFYKEPKAFSGGELRMYETGVDGQSLYKRGTFKDIEPRNNSIVFFPSRLLHEVMPVSCPSKAFGHGRFTFNGWLRR